MIKEITLTNYRCFNHLTLSFGEKTNLLIGDNASGKTTIVRALKSCLNSFFSGFSDKYTRFVGLSEDDFAIVNSASGLANEQPIRIDFRFLKSGSSLMRNSFKGRTLKDSLKPITKESKLFYEHLFDENKKQALPLPLLACFSTADIHSSRKISMEQFKTYEHKPSFGYYECLQGDGFLPYWTKRLLVLKEANRGQLEIDGVRNAIKTALGKQGCNIVNDIEIRHNQGRIYYLLPDGREIDTDNLSDGYRRLISIVIDLAFRCMLLNKGFYGLDACAKTQGTVLIDEIDLHLHPTLQLIVMQGLKRAFPSVQFIVTSHAPMVMTGIKQIPENKVYKLGYNQDNGYTVQEIQTYGLDASTIIEVILGVTPRSEEVNQQLDDLFKQIDEEKYAEANAKLKILQEQFGDRLPDLAKAQAMLNFLDNNDDCN